MDNTFLQNNQKRDTEIGAYVTIRYCVMEAIARLPEQSMGEYRKLLQIAISCVRDLRLFHEASIEVAYLEPNEAGIIPFPTDCIDYLKIGIPINGQLYILTLNDSMLLNRATKCGTDLRQVYTGNALLPEFTDGYLFTDHWWNGRYITGLYGMGGGFNTGYYRVDNKMRQIQIDGVIPRSEIVMEYKSTGLNSGSMITAQSIGTIRNYILWQREEFDPRIPNTQKERRKQHYEEELEKLRTYTNMPKKQEIYDVLYRSYKQSPKR